MAAAASLLHVLDDDHSLPLLPLLRKQKQRENPAKARTTIRTGQGEHLRRMCTMCFWLFMMVNTFTSSTLPMTNDSRLYRGSRPLVGIPAVAAIPHTIKTTKQTIPAKLSTDEYDFTNSNSRVSDLVALFQKRPSLLLSASIRIAVAMALETVLDGLLKGVVTPIVLATGIGAIAAPLTFLLEYTLQPIIHSVAFMVFDDRFLMATLDATGIQGRLLEGGVRAKKGLEWHKLSFMEGYMTRYVIKSLAAWSMGWAGLLTVIPVVGQLLSAWLTGWIVTWDYVYVPLSGMHHVGPRQQFKSVWQHLGAYQWFGFWAVLLEELPFLGPTCHVWNVYSAAFFLERVYILQNKYSDVDDDATAATVASEDSSSFEL